MSAGQGELSQTSARHGTCVKSEDSAQSGRSLDTCVKSEDFTQSGPGLDTCVKSEDFPQSGPSLDTCVKSEDFTQSGPGPASGATLHDTDAHLPAAGGGAHKKHLTSEQVVDIFTHKTFKTTRTTSILSEKYSVSSKTIRDIWTLKR